MKIIKFPGKPSVFLRIVGIVLLFLLYFYLYKLLIPKINAFGCMDDCTNFMGGYFLLHGKQLFSQIFFNHAPFMAHISAFIQYATRPDNLHAIILRHRQFVLLFGFLSEIVLILRFGIVGLPFAALYELTKFYLGGDRFLGEGLIIYPMIYVLGLIFLKLQRKKLFSFDFLIAAISTWFVIFTREPYSIAVLFMLGVVLWNKKQGKIKIISGAVFFTLCLITIFSYNIRELFYNMVFVNKTILASENVDTGIFGINIYKSFLYPVVIFFQGKWSMMRYIEMSMSGVFLLGNAVFIWKKEWKWLLFLWIILGFANLRLIAPGYEYYGAFHLLPWYALTIFATLLMLFATWTWNKKIFVLGIAGLAGIIVFLFVSKSSYIHDNINQQAEFITNYGNYLQVGNVVDALSEKKDTLFVDGFDDAIYLVANRYSPYQYSWYTSFMPQYKKYTDARIAMFRKTPPDFYYGSCIGQKNSEYLLPDFAKGEYQRLYNLENPSCLWIKKSKFVVITDAQWQKAGENLYYQSPTNR